MIARVWLQIAAILVAAVVPLFLLDLQLQREALQLTRRWAVNNAASDVQSDHLAALKELARLLPERAPEMKRRFDEALEYRRDSEDLQPLGASLDRDLERQTLLYAATVLVLSLLLAVWLARHIVERFRTLVAERERAAMKVAKLSALENWQETARMLVHELRGPMTPIQLIASDLEHRYESLNAVDFGHYLRDGAAVLKLQAQNLATMVETFTAFGKLPTPKPSDVRVSSFLENFLHVHGAAFAGRARITLENAVGTEHMARFDPVLISSLLINLFKNACEANPTGLVPISVSSSSVHKTTWIRVANQGALIPKDLVLRIFEPRISTKATMEAANMGLGLAIAKKIALDHGGDLVLLYNDPVLGVVFELEIP